MSLPGAGRSSLLRSDERASPTSSTAPRARAARGRPRRRRGRLRAASSSPTARELHAHCYRMLGSVHDAEDALQDALLRAWRGLPRVRGPQLAALLALHDRDQHLPERDRAAAQARAADRLRPGRRPPRRRPASRSSSRCGSSPTRTRSSGSRTASPAPEARYEQRESVELAFVAALQHLPANQRAVLILREVLGFSAARGRRDARDHASRRSTARCSAPARRSTSACPSRASRRRCARSATSALREIVEGYVDAMGARRRRRGRRDAGRGRRVVDAADVDAGTAAARRSVAFLTDWPLSGEWRWRRVRGARQRPAGGRLLQLGRGVREPTCRSRSTC